MNEEIILSMVAPYVKEGAITYDEFDKIFSILSRKEQYVVSEILFKTGINLVDRYVEEDAFLLLDVDSEISSDIEFDDGFEILYDDTIFKDKKVGDTYDNALITHKEIRQSNEILCQLIQEGNDQAAQDLCVKNKLLVDKYALLYEKRYGNCVDFEDLEQVGFLGLIKAAQRFNIHQDVSFGTYSVYWIKQCMAREIIDNGYTIRIPVHMIEKINKVISVNNQITKTDISLAERITQISEELGFSEEEVRECIVIKNNYLSYTSLETPIGDDKDSILGDFIPDEDEISLEQIVYNKELRQKIEFVLQTLSDRERLVIKLKFGLDDDKPRTFEEIGKMFHLTRERIRQIENKAMRKLCHHTRFSHLKIFKED